MPRPISRIAMARGLFGGSRGWLAVWVLAVSTRALRRFIRKDPKVVYCEDLAPGESLVITHLTHHVR